MIAPGIGHAAFGSAVAMAFGGAALLTGQSPLWGWLISLCWYVSRERRQSEEHYGSNRIPPWWWKPRTGRDLLWPALGAAVVTALLFAVPALAHQAPSGWAYDRECCHNLDCAPAPDGAIREVQGGYQVTLAPGSHPMVRDRTVTGFVPHGDPRIRVSGDEDRHACVSGTGRILCIYIPPGGV